MAPTPQQGSQDDIAAQALLSALTEFAARAGHDIIGPLNQAGSLLALFIRQTRGQENAGAVHLLDFLQNSSDRMERLTEGVRKFMDVASRRPRITPVDLNAALQTAREMLAQPILQSGAEVLSDELPVVSADAEHMVTMFWILIGNSIRFRSPDSPPKIRISGLPADGVSGIIVSDNGTGIEPEYREALLLPFRRLGGNGGAGLGLATAKLIAEFHGGSIRIDTALSGSGTAVTFTVPQGQTQSRP